MKASLKVLLIIIHFLIKNLVYSDIKGNINNFSDSSSESDLLRLIIGITIEN